MNRKRFERLVEEALRTIPARFRREIENVAVIVEDEPPPDVLDEMGIEPPDTLFGLYQGTPLPERTWTQAPPEPDRISIYQRPIEDACETEDDIVATIAETVIHEFGHYFGLSEEEIEDIEERYWRGEDLDADETAGGVEAEGTGGRGGGGAPGGRRGRGGGRR
jgi:predicted Zn-dependent protease with MMP-like domain